MAVCALLNIGVLLTNTLNMMLSQGYAIHLRSQFDFGWCRMNAFVAQWIRGMASWILVLVAFDRFQQSKTVRRTQTKNNHIVLYLDHLRLILNVLWYRILIVKDFKKIFLNFQLKQLFYQLMEDLLKNKVHQLVVNHMNQE